jgi:response regulator RpfG family c-di-GMP phosphodiesterase
LGHIPGQDPQTLVPKIREARPDVTIVGTGTGDHREAFAALGVERYVRKPWSMVHLVELLSR